MEIVCSQENEFFKINVQGDLDASSALDMDEVIKEALNKDNVKILIDCQDLNYISSAGLGVFVSHLDEFRENEGGIVFFNMKGSVYNVFKILGLHKLMQIENNESSAKRYLSTL